MKTIMAAGKSSTWCSSSVDRCLRPLHSGFLQSVELDSGAPALQVSGRTVSYGELCRHAASIAATVQARRTNSGTPLTAVLATKSATGYAAILGSLMSGSGYVPLNPRFPPARTRAMLEQAECRTLIVDARSEAYLDEVIGGFEHELVLVAPDSADSTQLERRWPTHSVIAASGLESAERWRPVETPQDAVAYLLFTSGSTGFPKGVAVTHANVSPFLAVMADRFDFCPSDRFSQMFDTTFDLSIFDMFVAWDHGACVCCPPESRVFNPDQFVRESSLTVWASVPSLAQFMKRLGVLKPNRFASLRWSVFCGEPLPDALARSWWEAAPGSTVENLYGPTELTVACSMYRWRSDAHMEDAPLGIVPIGDPTPGMESLVVDNDLREVEAGEEGELLMTGPQMTSGYWRNPEATAKAYVRPPGQDRLFYRTGDRVRKPRLGAPFTYVGRIDDQVKVLGHRVELGEVESRLREEPSLDGAAAIGWPRTPSGVAGIVAFVTGTNVDVDAIGSNLAAKLPSYAVPRAIHVLPTLPHNSNGKLDRNALVRLLEGAADH